MDSREYGEMASTNLTSKTAEPGATDNPDDAHRI